MASEACCAAGQPLMADYEPIGERVRVNDFDVYVTGAGTAAVLVVYDIFGFDFKQVFQVCDRLAAEAGVLVACPDFFRGAPWKKEKTPPKPEHNFMGWITTAGSYDNVVSKDLHATASWLRSNRGISGKLGSLGFCWGASMALQAGADPAFSAVGCVHPSTFGRDKQLAEACQAPVIILPAKGDPMESLKEVFDGKPFGLQCVYRRFDDQQHGFCAARGDWARPEVAAAATEAVGLLGDFYMKTLL